jgi:hypothetical protein
LEIELFEERACGVAEEHGEMAARDGYETEMAVAVNPAVASLIRRRLKEIAAVEIFDRGKRRLNTKQAL